MDYITKAQALNIKLTRRELAKAYRVHADTITRLMADGLASAVLVWGGRGKLTVFSNALADRFEFARRCDAGASGGRCARCRLVLEDAKYVAEHLMQARHGIFDPCTQPDPEGDCHPPTRFSAPCLWSW